MIYENECVSYYSRFTVTKMNSSYRAFVKELNNDMDKFQNTSIISEDILIDKYSFNHPLIHKSIITKVVRHNWKLIPTRIGFC